MLEGRRKADRANAETPPIFSPMLGRLEADMNAECRRCGGLHTAWSAAPS
jgi:hypothetical protein